MDLRWLLVAPLALSAFGCHGCSSERASGSLRSGAAKTTTFRGALAMQWRDVPHRKRPESTTLRWEAERPRATNFPQANPFAPANPAEAALLSGGAWIGAESHGQAFFLEYEVDVPRGGSFSLYARKFWKHGPSRWRFDTQEWKSVGAGVALLDEVPIREFLVVNWVNMGSVALTPGRHTLRIELGETHRASAWDEFLLTDGPFQPRGLLKPGDDPPPAPAGFFTFDPERDDFAESPLDLRALNEPVAGAGGPIAVRGGELVHSKSGEPVRFWGVDIHEDFLGVADPERAYLARSLAKRGVNLVRIMAPLFRDDDLTRIDQAKLDTVQHWVADLAAQGIYSALSLYFPVAIKPRASDGYPGYEGQQATFALQYFDDKFAALQRGWWRQVLSAKSAYSRPPLGEDPALAIVELVNEDSSLFWTFDPYKAIPAATMLGLEKSFGAWLTSRYGTLEKAFETWQQGTVRGDDLAAARAGFLGLWQLSHEKTRRSQDTAEFLTRRMRRFYEASYSQVKQDLGFRGVVVCSNWITADTRVLGPLDKWANTACDAMDHHGYYSGPHSGGPAASYAVGPGDRYADASALRFDPDAEDSRTRKFDLPFLDPSYDGKPSLVSEIGWPRPNRFRAELPFLAASYGMLQGTDGFAFSSIGPPGFDRMLGKFSVSDPTVLGQFPATALVFRRGLVQTGAPVASLDADLASLFRLEGTAFAGGENLDTLRKGDVPSYRPVAPGAAASVHPLAYLVGPVALDFRKNAASTKVVDLSGRIDDARATVRSETGELAWEWHDGVATLDTALAQGAAGFLGARPTIDLGQVRIEADFEYGTVLVVSLDGAPLASSSKFLIQVMTEAENHGFRVTGSATKTIESAGGPGVVVKQLGGQLTFKRAGSNALHFTALDPNGYPSRESTEPSGRLVLLPSTLYYLATSAN